MSISPMQRWIRGARDFTESPLWRGPRPSLAGVLCLALLTVLPGSAYAQDASVTFRRVLDAQWHTAYSGIKRTVVTSDGKSGIVEAQVVQKADGHRMVTVTNPQRRAGETQVDDGAFLWHYDPQKNAVMLSPTEVGKQRGEGRSRSPLLSPNGSDTIAGRPTISYTVVYSRPDAPKLRWWVDTATLVPLRTELTTRDGKQITEEYEQIDFAHPGEVQFVWPAGAALYVRSWTGHGERGPFAALRTPVALPEPLPPGVVCDSLCTRDLAGRSVLWLHFRLHHGAEASLFETTSPPSGEATPGVNVENWNLGPLNITMVGNLAPGVRAALRSALRIVH